VRISAAGIAIANDSKVTNDKQRSWLTAGGALLWMRLGETEP